MCVTVLVCVLHSRPHRNPDTELSLVRLIRHPNYQYKGFGLDNDKRGEGNSSFMLTVKKKDGG